MNKWAIWILAALSGAGALADQSPPNPTASMPAEDAVRALENRPLLTSDTTPKCVPNISRDARLRGAHGITLLLVFVGINGRADKAKVEVSSGNDYADRMAAGCVISGAHFTPAAKDGEPFASWQRMKWTWNLSR